MPGGTCRDARGFESHNQLVMAIYWNKEYKSSFKRDNCPEDLGSTEVFVVPEGQFVSRVSQADADQKAADYAASEGQKFANSFGACCNVYYNRKQEGEFYSSVCAEGTKQQVPTTHTIAAAAYYSTDSAEDANRKAREALLEEGQALADANGECLPIYWNTRQHGWFSKKCREGWKAPEKYMSIDAGKVYSFVGVDDANDKAMHKLTMESRKWVEENTECYPDRTEEEENDYWE